MIKKFALALLALLLIIAGLAATKPDTFAVQRSVTIAAPPERIMGLVCDFRNWRSWSPWEELDPAMERSFAGAPIGVGAVYSRKGNADVGAGRMEIVEVAMPTKAVIKLAFLSPIESNNMTTFSLVPEGANTRVLWETSGPMHYITKVMNVFVSMDKMIGPDFERGLARLKAAAEK